MHTKKIDSFTTLYQTDRFKTVVVHLYYPFPLEEKDLVAATMLPQLLMQTSRAYPEEDLHHKEALKRSILSMGCRKQRAGKQFFYKVSLVLPDAEALKEDNLESAFSFCVDTIYNPNIKEEAFIEEDFLREKENLILALENEKKEIGSYSYNKVVNLIDREGFLKQNLLFNHQELVDNVTAKEVYTFYKKVMENVRPYVFVLGNVEEEHLRSILNENLDNRSLKQGEINQPYTSYLSQSPKTIIEEETGPYHQSILEMVYKVKDFKKEDNYLLRTVDALLSSISSMILHKFLRDKEQLVYQTGSFCKTTQGILWITALLYKENKEKAIKSVKEAMESLKDETFIEPLLKNIKEKARLSLIRKQDKKFALLGGEEDVCFGIEDSLEKQYEIASQITTKEIKEFVERIELDVVYFLAGDKNES
ncbi:MAG: insulinase family protein [Bacilli bacterium]|nr:insulinase family protein [Bacilli bacterium]